MSHNDHPSRESPFSPSFTSVTSGSSHSAWMLSDHSRAILPRFIVAFQASDSPGSLLNDALHIHIERNSLRVFQQLLHWALLMYHMNYQIVRDPWPLIYP
jgi:hypothetical protein